MLIDNHLISNCRIVLSDSYHFVFRQLLHLSIKGNYIWPITELLDIKRGCQLNINCIGMVGTV